MRLFLCVALFCLTQTCVNGQHLLFEFDQAYEEFGYQPLYDTVVLEQFDLVCLPITYSLNRGEIQEHCYGVLDSVVVYLKAHPKLRVEIQNHSDERGSKQYSIKLEEKRAEAVMLYLVEQGIPRERLVPKGFGEDLLLHKGVGSRSISKEEKERLHQINRRTVLMVLETGN